MNFNDFIKFILVISTKSSNEEICSLGLSNTSIEETVPSNEEESI